LASLNAQLQSALASLGGLYGDALKYGQNLSVAQMLKIYDSLSAGMDPAVRAAIDPIVRQLAYDVTQVHYQQRVQVALEEQAAKVRQAKIVAIQTRYRAEQEQFQEELGGLWAVNAVATVQDAAPDMLTMLRNEAIGVGKVLYGLTPIPYVVKDIQCIAGGWSGMSGCAQDARDEWKSAWHLAQDTAMQSAAADQILLDVINGDNGATFDQYWDAKYQIYRDFTYGPTYDACKNGAYDKCGQGLGETEATIALLLVPSAAAGTSAKLAADATRIAEATRIAGATRIFTSADAEVANAANAIEIALPGRVQGVNTQVQMTNGLTREVDIDLGYLVVQVKSGNARGLAGQLQATTTTTGRTAIGYAPGISNAAWESAARQGIVIARTPDELIAIVKELAR
jgi:hypothetical protein